MWPLRRIMLYIGAVRAREWFVIRTAIALLILAGANMPALAQGSSEPGMVIVRGTGAVEVAPDVADIIVGVQTEGVSPAEAIDANSEAMKRVIDDAKRAGVDPRDVQTSILDLRPLRDNKESRKYAAVNTARIRVRDLPRLGAVTRSLISSGANELRGVRFSTSNPTPHLDRARQQAVDDAKRRAEVLAAAAGRRLGDIAEISEETYGDPGIVAMARTAGAAADIPTEAGQVTHRASVQIKWRLAP
jgi:uncharacterized protein YggE